MANKPNITKAIGNEVATTLAAGISDSATTITVSSGTGISATGGYMIIDENITGKEEVVYVESASGTTLTISTNGRGLAGTSAVAHDSGATVTDIIVDDHINGIATKFLEEHDDNGAHTVIRSNMSRQAIINGSFDVWQRGISATLADSTIKYLADRWQDYAVGHTGTLPTLTRSRSYTTLLPGKAYYISTLTFNGAGTSLGTDSYHRYTQKIENGVRILCGVNKTVTLSFYARSSVANKRIGVDIRQNYGTGGSPTSVETINGTNWTLDGSSNWQLLTHTFTTNTLSGKTFGDNADDYIAVDILPMWGSTFQSWVGASSAETYVASGTIDITGVQLCAGDVALEFEPKPFNVELQDCLRYFETDYNYGTAVPTNTAAGLTLLTPVSATVGTIANLQSYGTVSYKTPKRTAATPVIYPYTTATNTSRVSNKDGTDLGANSGVPTDITDKQFHVYNNTGGNITAALNIVAFHWSVDAEL